MISGFAGIEAALNQNRDARELDITVEEARTRKIVNGNETFIGRRVIDSNIARDNPTFIKYLTNSPRQIVLRTSNDTFSAENRAHIEREFTNGFRTGAWLEEHLKAVDSMLLHGRGVFLVTASDNAIGQVASYIAPEDFIFPIEVRDIQAAPMIAIRYPLPVTQFEEWAQKFDWLATETETILQPLEETARITRILYVYQVIYKEGGKLNYVWYYFDTSRLLTQPKPYFGGFVDETGAPRPTAIYPIFPVYSKITENPKLVERKGRAHADMHDQEALTVGWTSICNAAIRSSEIYPYRADDVPNENPEVVQTDTVLRPGVVTKTKLQFFSPPPPDPLILTVLQSLRTENSSAAGQVDFAAQARKDSRKTATELDLASEQATDMSSGPLTSFAVGYTKMLQYMWDVLQNNMMYGVNKTFLADADDQQLREMLSQPMVGPDGLPLAVPQTRFTIVAAGDIDYIERQKKLQRYVQYFPLFEKTGVAQHFLMRILELAFPDDYQQLAPLMQDQSKNMGTALLHILESLPPEAVPPDKAADFQQIIAQAQQVFGAGPNQGQNVPGPNAQV